MTTWEYKVLETASEDDLNDVGLDGWELVGQLPVLMPSEDDEEEAQPVLVFKRPVETE